MKDKLDCRRTRRALKIYDADLARREAAWARVGSNKGARACEAADRLALVKVQLAFAVDTYDRNSLDNCMRMSIAELRRMGKIGE